MYKKSAGYAILEYMSDYSDIAYNNVNKSFTADEGKKILSGNDDILKSALLLNLDEIDEELAELLIFNLTNQSGPVRELSSYRLNELIKKYKSYFQNQKTLDTILLAINDVNPNVVRFILPALKYFDNKKYLLNCLIEKIEALSIEVSNKLRRGKEQEHIFTKKCFKIYWSLEGIKYLITYAPNIIYDGQNIREDFNDLLKSLCKIEEYTVREKVAQIVNLLPVSQINDIKVILDKDENYFVRRVKNEDISGR